MKVPHCAWTERFHRVMDVGPAAVLAVILLLVSGCRSVGIGGAGSREEAVSLYLHALEQGSETALLPLIPATHDAADLVHQKVLQLGGHPLADVKIAYRVEFGPSQATATITGRYTSTEGMREFADEVNLEEIGRRWYVIMGSVRDGGIPLDAPTLAP